MVIEEIAGKSYGAHLNEALFLRNRLSSTVYCSVAPII